jgi:HK97 gp10 family phage protein
MARGHKLRGKAFSFELDGLKELDQMLQDLPKAMSKTVLRNALKKAGAPIRDEAAANAPHGPTGNLAKSIVVSTKLKKSQRRRMKQRDAVEVFVGATAPHAYLVEFGSAERQRKNGASTGVMPSNPFFTRAWDATKATALKILVAEIRVELLKAAKRLRERAEKGTLSKRSTEALRK